MYTNIKTFEDACKVLNLDAATVIPDFSLFPEADKEAMIAHAKLIIIAKAINGDWTPDWTNGQWDKYYPWFVMGSPSGGGFSYYDYDLWYTISYVGSRLCFESSEKAKYAGNQFQDLYKAYFVKA
jgi:hypothetical protein